MDNITSQDLNEAQTELDLASREVEEELNQLIEEEKYD